MTLRPQSVSSCGLLVCDPRTLDFQVLMCPPALIVSAGHDVLRDVLATLHAEKAKDRSLA